MTRDELMKYKEVCGEDSAINLLLLGGPDRYSGDYEKDMEELESGADDYRNEHQS